MCNYCQGKVDNRLPIIMVEAETYENDDIEVYINGEDKLTTTESIAEEININFCPMCGRSLKGESK